MGVSVSPGHPYTALAVLLVIVGLPVWVASEAARRGRRGWAYGLTTLVIAPLGLAALGLCAITNQEARTSRSAAGVVAIAMLTVAAGFASAGALLHA